MRSRCEFIMHQNIISHRPKLLFLAYTFPPRHAVACVRAWNIAKYLAAAGWELSVVTPAPEFHPIIDRTTLIDADLHRSGARRILTDHRWRILLRNYYDGILGVMATRACRRLAYHLNIEPSVGWLGAAEAACRTLTGEDVDVILATGPPFGAFQLAKQIADKLGRPYVLDYRDPWTGNPYAARRRRQAAVKLEQRVLRGSAAVTVVSPSWKEALDRHYDVGLKLHVVTNGYDPEELAVVEPHDFGHFAIVYTGIFYPPKRVITPLMSAFRLLKRGTCTGGTIWRFHYYGNHADHVRREAERFKVTDHVVLHGKVPRKEVLSAVRGAGVAVVVNSTTNRSTLEDRGQIPAKLFEPLGLGTPILLIAPPGSDARDIIRECCASQSFTGEDIEGIARYLLERMRAKRTHTVCSDRRYSWPALAGTMNMVLRGAIGQRFPAVGSCDGRTN